MERAIPRRALAGIILAALIMAVAALAFQVLKPSSRITYDEQTHHVPAIRRFAEQMPTPDLRDYPVATTPGYHLVMAMASRYLGANESGLRGINIGLSMGLMGILGWGLAKRQPIGWAVLLGLPLLLCVYVVTSAAWLLPENAAWALVALILVLALERPTTRTIFMMGAALAVLVLVRQAHVWCGAVILAAALMDEDTKPNLRRGALGAAATVPAAVALGAFVTIWGGLVPPMFQPGGKAYELSTQYGGWGPAAPAFTLAMLGFFGVPLLAWFWPAARQRLGKRFWTVVLIGAAAGLIVGLVPETSYHFPDRRSGLWRAVDMLPVFHERSPLIVCLAAAGGAVVTLAFMAVGHRERAILAVALFGFVAAQTVNPMIWQRYYEPFLLIWLVLAASQTDGPTRTRGIARPLQIGGLSILIGLEVIVTWFTLKSAG